MARSITGPWVPALRRGSYATSDIGPTASQRGLNYAGQDEEDGR
jgi:hypothetical protein